MKSIQSSIALFCVFLLLAPAGFAQQQVNMPGAVLAPKETHWYTPFVRKYTPFDVAPINLANSSRLESLIRAGNIYLSLQDAIALALENNLDIEVQRYGPRLAEANLLRAQAGGLLRGQTQSVTAGPSSAVSQLNGGSTSFQSSSGGAGASSNGTIITSTGTSLPNLDPVFFTNYTWAHSTNLQSSSFASGTPSQVFNSGNTSVGIQQGFLSGTTATLGYNSQNLISNNVRSEINPVRTGNMNLQVTQRLLQGFGFAVNSRNIRIAKNSIRLSDLVFKQQVIATISSVINLYTDLVSFNENVKVNKQALALNEKLYSDNKKQVEIGTLAPIEIVKAEAEVASSQNALTQSETQVLQQETILKNALSRTGVASPTVAEARIIPTDSLSIPDVEQVTPIQDLIAAALANRPEIAQTEVNIENTKIQLQGTKSQLRPSLDLVGNLQNNGIAGSPNTVVAPIDPNTGLPIIRIANPAFLGGFGTLFDQIFSRNYPNYSLGFQLNIPLRNRSAQADLLNDQLSLRQGELNQRKQINQVRVDVQNAVIGLQQSRSQYQSAQKSRVLQEQTLDAEQKKYALGASTIFFVIQAQRDLAQAKASEVAALSTYNRAKVSLYSATGETLERYNVTLDEAIKGQVARPAAALP
ncbi:MAG: TolC family protein [Bryobacteraceae bacterium]